MKMYTLIFLIFSVLSVFTHAQTTTTTIPAPAIVEAPVVVPAPAPVVPEGSVAVSEPAAPPKWAEDVIMTAQKLPVVGPIISKILVYLGIISSILTALIAFLLTALSALSGVLNLTGLASFAEKIQLFKKGKFMYWLKYLSMFNAKKPENKPR